MSIEITADLEAAVAYLKFHLHDMAGVRREDMTDEKDEEIAARLEELADAVGEIPPDLLAAYADALVIERKPNGPQCIHVTMMQEIGEALHPRNIEDVCRIYIRAVELARLDPRFADPDTDDHLDDFWREFARAGRA